MGRLNDRRPLFNLYRLTINLDLNHSLTHSHPELQSSDPTHIQALNISYARRDIQTQRPQERKSFDP